MKKIQVLPYDSLWPIEFEKAKKFYDHWLKDVKVEVVHVGSTSIKGLWAKPILDIDIIVAHPSDSLKVIQLLKKLAIYTWVLWVLKAEKPLNTKMITLI